MKILRITAQGLPLFKEELDICFYAQQRVSEDDKNNLYNMIGNYYLHSACAFIGINASGKTSVLRVINLALSIIKNEPINHIREGKDRRIYLFNFIRKIVGKANC